ncbi:ABC transporter permease [Enterococcus rivorum]|uniref:ABC3 transporter permease C-terminal domain-containing protein n=1 Tax=Enterococcus rivorum TaxID=762845 RepID=A0A1E5KX92_9ENTE|nr:ABC transporter permease [Enterococcus rivorum]MBP2099979.1 putative ABC transport system permease protein [Enterococcus rivorum]OEH82490.1 hypothetical protein BCR26_13460 [Enterococcus rivorum]
MISSLFWKNFKAQFHGYLVYFFSMTFAVVVYYCFSAITYNQPLVSRAEQDVSISGAMNFGGVLIVIIILGFMMATNHFFLLRRGKEIGLYHLLGMRKSQISLLFFMETSVLGVLSLVTGISLGIILSKLFSMILAKAMFLQIDSPFYVSFPSMFQTAMVFGFTLLVVSINSFWSIYRYRLDDQLREKSKQKVETNKLTKTSVLFGILGIFLIAFGYFLAYNIVSFTTLLMKSVLGFPSLLYAPFFIMLICMLGTYFFYRNTMSLVVYLLGKNKNSYYRDLRMVALGNVSFQIRHSRKTLTVITLFIAIALGMISGAASLYTLGMHSVNLTNPTDFIVSEEIYKQAQLEIEKEPETVIEKTIKLNYKLTGSQFVMKIGQEQRREELRPINVLSLSNYQKYKKINPYLKELKLKNDQETVLIDSLQNIMRGFIRYESPIILQGGTELKIASTRADFLGQSLLRYDFPTIIVSDKKFAQITEGLTYNLWAFDVHTTDEEALANHLSDTIKPEWIAPIYYDYTLKNNQIEGYVSSVSQKNENENMASYPNAESEHWRLNYTSRFPELRYKRREMGLFIYIAMFLGILSLLITGSVLMLRQFSDFSRERSNYELLKRIGIPKKEISKLIYQQNSIIFFPPMFIGILHAIFAIYVFSNFVESSGYWLAYVSCGILLLIYLSFYLLTAAIYSRMIFSKRD